MAREPAEIVELRRSLGAALATFRQAAELTQGRLAKIAICDRTTIVHIEKGRARADERFWRVVDDACGAAGALVAAYLELEATKAEREQRERDQRLTAVRARAAELRGRHGPAGNGQQSGFATDLPVLDGLRGALLGHQPERDGCPALNPDQVRTGVLEAHRLYQRADYDEAARLLPSVIGSLEVSSTTISLHIKVLRRIAACTCLLRPADTH